MSGIILTQYDGAILGPIAKILGYLMNWIFIFLDKIGIPNIGLAIILFTIVIYMLLLPLTIKQQKFSKLNAKMNPELQAIRKKYEGKKDNESMAAMNAETQEVYAKYGVSPTGSCVQLLIQMPILFALYRVIYAIPAYVPMVKEAYTDVVNGLFSRQAEATEFLRNLENSGMFKKQFENELFKSGDKTYVTNTFIDCLNRATSGDWDNLAITFSELKDKIISTKELIEGYNNFLGINVGNSPSYMAKEAIVSKNYLLVIVALIIPVLAAATQWLNTKLMPQAESNGNDQNDTMAQSMKTMNTVMPIMSMVFCFSMPAGMGIYWIAGAVIRSIQQVVINKKLDKMDIDAVIEKNKDKAQAKIQKQKDYVANLNRKANVSTKNLSSINNSVSSMSKEEKEEKLKKATEYYNSGNAKPGSLASKANMVKQYNERNNK